MTFSEWAHRWGIPPAAIEDLRTTMLQLDGGLPAQRSGRSEAAIQAALRVRASKLGMRLWRNNVGAFKDPQGNFIRFGLANDSSAINRVIKSADLIGIRPRIVQPADVGFVLGQFVSREVKHGNWKYTGTEPEVAQLNWAGLVNSLGGDAGFATSEEHI
jgi:hypothetical protein